MYRTPAPTTAAPLICRTCNLPPRNFQRLKRGRCDACYTYWHQYGRERPPNLWHRCHTGRLGVRV